MPFIIQSMLFGDGGTVALLVGSEEGKLAFGPISHLTNEATEDLKLMIRAALASTMKPPTPSPMCSD
jgi:hypothetical protein